MVQECLTIHEIHFCDFIWKTFDPFIVQIIVIIKLLYHFRLLSFQQDIILYQYFVALRIHVVNSCNRDVKFRPLCYSNRVFLISNIQK